MFRACILFGGISFALIECANAQMFITPYYMAGFQDSSVGGLISQYVANAQQQAAAIGESYPCSVYLEESWDH